jgi:apolipoprotein N-acyltransferase
LLSALNRLARENTELKLVALSEYTLQRPPPPELLEWCRRHNCHLIVGGRDPIPGGTSDNAFRNTAFVIDPRGEVVFRQVKSVPIQFFQDGERARERKPWISPWGPMGLAVCYDLSYRWVMDEFVAQGVGMLVIPTADESGWGAYQHVLHARVARVRAAEYGLPIVRAAGSGISQHVDASGREQASAPFPGPGEVMLARVQPSVRGRLPLDIWLAPASLVLALGAVTVALAVGRVARFHLPRSGRRAASGGTSSCESLTGMRGAGKRDSEGLPSMANTGWEAGLARLRHAASAGRRELVPPVMKR